MALESNDKGEKRLRDTAESKPSHMERISGGVAAPKGFWAIGVKAGIKYKGKYDLALIVSETAASAAAVYTRNKVKAHPLLLTQSHLQNGQARGIVVNSGNANACVGEKGDEGALSMASAASQGLGLAVDDIVVASTGVIGVELPLPTVLKGIQEAVAQLEAGMKANETGRWREENAHNAAQAIMTTDLEVKEISYALHLSQGVVKIGAIAKGSGMIHPNMGTMLGFITTDAMVEPSLLQNILRQAVDESFNMVTVDGDTSTNDMVILLANGASGITPEGEDKNRFIQGVHHICVELAKAIAKDGEGATKLLEVETEGAPTLEDARKIAKSICGSSLVKTAMFGEDANWGRILVAAGYSGAEFDPDQVDIYLDDLPVALAGRGVPFSEERAKEILQQAKISIRLNIHGGNAKAVAWGCDLSYEYVNINGSYRT